jgi:hypothetical protein
MMPWFRPLRLSFALCSMLILGGCQALGVAAYKLVPPPTIQPKYTGLAGQTVGVMIWADRGIRIDWPALQLDLANTIDKKLKDEVSAAAKGKVLEGTTYPIQPASIVRYQHEHPEIESLQITDVAPKLGVSRLIYVEVEDFATRAAQSVDLYRGRAKATVRLVEVKDGQAKIVFEQNNVQATFPPKSTADGVPSAGGDPKIYAGTIDAFATEIVHLFVPYQQEDW